MTVQALDGAAWRVRVVWEPRWRALARRFGGWRRKRKDRDGGPDFPDPGLDLPSGGHHSGGGFFDDLADDLVVGIAIIIGMIVFGLLFWWLLLPLLLLILDVMIVVLLVIAGVVGRVLFRRPWLVEATGPQGGLVTTEVVGWRAALRTRDEIADKLRLGYRPEDVAAAHR
ncbi:hypothetical protein Ate02nite_36360 [Paractinoplanes tereljensis]|uniref:Uncharacterized protein n=1 Tax=Paractinoplanes tereljensis TaxID=571912 RepID=A0A919NMY6_9ACTN|nr:hypothetical protein Ate02nite_36360 [Actinoplanes tereljensis]